VRLMLRRTPSIRALSVLAMLALPACGAADSATGPTPTPSYAKWTVDAQTCTGSDVVSLFVDGTAVGSETLAAGGSSKLYQVQAGSHVIGATEARVGGFVWPSQTVSIPSGQTFTQVLTC
jgi:hypothetical protein